MNSELQLLASLLVSNDESYLQDFYYFLAQPILESSTVNSKLSQPASALDELNSLHTKLEEPETEEYIINVQFKSRDYVDTSLDKDISTQKKISNKINEIADVMSDKANQVQSFLNSSGFTNYLGGIDTTLTTGTREIAGEFRTAAKALDPSTSISELKSMARGTDVNSNLATSMSNLSSSDKLNNLLSSSLSSDKDLTNQQLHEMVASLDGQTNVYIAFFTKNDKFYPIEDYINQRQSYSDKRYYYFFFTDDFEFTSTKKTTTNLKYGAFSTKIALNQADGKTEFSFSIDSDLALTMWTFIRKENLGYSNEGYISNDTAGLGISLNIIMPEAVGPTGKSSLSFMGKDKDYLVNKFVLTDIKFTDMSELAFSNKSTDTLNIKLKGICNEVQWYPDFRIGKSSASVTGLRSSLNL